MNNQIDKSKYTFNTRPKTGQTFIKTNNLDWLYNAPEGSRFNDISMATLAYVVSKKRLGKDLANKGLCFIEESSSLVFGKDTFYYFDVIPTQEQVESLVIGKKALRRLGYIKSRSLWQRLRDITLLVGITYACFLIWGFAFT